MPTHNGQECLLTAHAVGSEVTRLRSRLLTFLEGNGIDWKADCVVTLCETF